MANHRVNAIRLELLCGIVDVCQKSGVEHIVSVFDARIVLIFCAVGFPYDVMRIPVRIGKTMTYADLFEMSEVMWRRLATVAGFDAAVLASPDVMRRPPPLVKKPALSVGISSL